MSGRRTDGTNPRAQGTNPRAIKAQLDRIEADVAQILRTLDRLTRQQRLGEHGPVTLDDGSVFLPGTGTIIPTPRTSHPNHNQDHERTHS